MGVTLIQATENDIETVWKMQTEAFSELLEKYQDYDTNPAAESLEKVSRKFSLPGRIYYFITAEEKHVGVICVIDHQDGSRKRISPIWIMPQFRGRGYAQKAILEAEKKHGSYHWSLDTILQEKGNLHLYEKLGYHQTGETRKINDRMDIVFYEKD